MQDLSFIPLSIHHLKLLQKWMQEPHVWKWWGEDKSWSFDDIQKKYGSYLKGYKLQDNKKKPLHSFVIELDQHPIGYIQFYHAVDFPRDGFDVKEICKEFPSLCAIDFYIGEPDYLGKGLGVRVLKSFILKHLFPHFNACLVDPDKNNTSAIKTYLKAGFIIYKEMESTIIMILKEQLS